MNSSTTSINRRFAGMALVGPDIGPPGVRIRAAPQPQRLPSSSSKGIRHSPAAGTYSTTWPGKGRGVVMDGFWRSPVTAPSDAGESGLAELSITHPA
jgi:hypothetical protein